MFPYQYIYPEQYEYMVLLKRGLDTQSTKNNTCMLEMPSGTGKTVTLLSFISGYQKAARERTRGAEFRQLFYCSRTIPEIEQVAAEAKRVYEKRKERYGDGYRYLVITMASRKNLCINKDVNKYTKGRRVDSLCRDKTAPWARMRSRRRDSTTPSSSSSSSLSSDVPQTTDIEDLCGCEFYKNFECGEVNLDENQVYSLDDLKEFGK